MAVAYAEEIIPYPEGKLPVGPTPRAARVLLDGAALSPEPDRKPPTPMTVAYAESEALRIVVARQELHALQARPGLRTCAQASTRGWESSPYPEGNSRYCFFHDPPAS